METLTLSDTAAHRDHLTLGQWLYLLICVPASAACLFINSWDQKLFPFGLYLAVLLAVQLLFDAAGGIRGSRLCRMAEAQLFGCFLLGVSLCLEGWYGVLLFLVATPISFLYARLALGDSPEGRKLTRKHIRSGLYIGSIGTGFVFVLLIVLLGLVIGPIEALGSL